MGKINKFIMGLSGLVVGVFGVYKGFSNKELSKLWEEYGENNFEYAIEKVLKYEDPNDDYTEELEELLEKYLLDKPQARRIGKWMKIL